MSGSSLLNVQHRVQITATTEDDGFFVLSVRVSRDDDTCELRTAPTDLYVAGADQPLPITNTSLPRT
ncbi:hypothetical protein [Streptomyces mirabilis]|uniref:hypothetical protein n=1 Tax=Streptomyces mirabilis TaxID=68239 RepID=UPI0036EE863A